MKIVDWPTSRLIPYARNPRKNDHAVSQMAGVIREFGFRVPIVAKSDGTVVDGHLRLKAAFQLGLETVPVLLADDLSEAQIKAFRLSVNKSAEWAEWDLDLLKIEMEELESVDFDMDLIGFDDQALKEMGFTLDDDDTADDDDTEEESIPEPPANPVTRSGDLWVLGEHRLLCGDSTDAGSVAILLAGAKPHLMVTDPPYGVEYDPEWRNKRIMATGEDIGEHGSQALGKVLNDNRVDWSDAWKLFEGNVAYVWHAPGVLSTVVCKNLQDAGFEIRMQIIWAKNHFAIGRGHYHIQHEPCWYAVRKKTGATGHWQGSRKETTLWQINKLNKLETDHSTQKPIECMLRPMVNNSIKGDSVYEPFCGSGTTIIAGENCGRQVYAMEISPTYCDVAVQRFLNKTGKIVFLENSGGKTFEMVAAERGVAL